MSHHFLKTTAALILIAGLLLGASRVAAEDGDAAIIAKLKDSKLSLADGIAQSEKENGAAISAKFELEGDKLSLSVYAAKAGLNKHAEHNTLIELSGDPTQGTWKSDTEVYEDKKHLTRSAMQLTLVQLSKITLADAIKKAEAVQAGTVYSITPAIKDGNPVFQVKIANAEGKSISVVVDGKTGEASK
jgi:uncharacterized membrane protein YkoI